MSKNVLLLAVFFLLNVVALQTSHVKYKLHRAIKNDQNLVSETSTTQMREKLKEFVNSNTTGRLWVVLAAGSESWYNYRHQADICHAYQIVKNHGVPDQRIIVFMKDDIAYHELNPDKGVIINRPGGPNVYTGVPKDYTGKNLNSTIFLDVLAGKNTNVGSGKTLTTGPNDRVFIYFADHGGPGVSMFGRGMLKATNLTDTILAMHKNKKYKEMVIYWESCHSGSMFQNLLPNNINVYALSASSPDEESYACYNDKHLRNYVGDCFSVHWMEDSDIENLNGESLFTQYLITKYRTNTSTVEQWGSKLKMEEEKVGDYLGSDRVGGQNYYDFSTSNLNLKDVIHPVKQSDVALRIKIMSSNNSPTLNGDIDSQKELDALLSKRLLMTDTIKKVIFSTISMDIGFPGDTFETPTILDFITNSTNPLMTTRSTLEECFYPVVKFFNDNCFQLTCNDYAIYQVKQFLPLCKMSISAVDSLRKSMTVHCKFENPICGIY